MYKLIAIFVLISSCLYGQGEVGYLIDEISSDSLNQRTVKSHSNVRPLIRQRSSANLKPFQFSGLGDVNYYNNTQSFFKAGLGIEAKGLLKNKFFYRIAGIGGVRKTNSFYNPQTFISDSLGNGAFYSQIKSRISYTPNHIFNFQAGVDNNFIGEGERSMFLSDYGSSYPFGQIRIRFWRLEYTILYQFLRERDNNQWEGKFATSHHISVNPTKWLNIGFFESVVFQPKDTLLNRGFDLEYMNPFILYRPQEYSLGSSDNVLLGVNLNAYWKEHTFYSQFIIDEFSLTEVRAKSGWWANKYGAQVGVKGRFKHGANNFFYRLEYNFVRPYTYAHLSEEFNYGNQGFTLAHPYGSNFMEILAEVKWENKRFYGELFANYYLKGSSIDGFNYGEDVYTPYINRPEEYGHYIGSGKRINGAKAIITLGYKVTDHGKLTAYIENHFDANTISKKVYYTPVIGIRSILWNDSRNF